MSTPTLKPDPQNQPDLAGVPVTLSRTLILSLLCGALSVLAFAPFGLWLVLYFTLGYFFVLVYFARSGAGSFAIGYFFGAGLFGGGVYWVYYSLHLFGAAVAPLAALGAALFVLLLALFPAFFARLVWRYRTSAAVWFLFAAPSLWLLFEWMRSWLFTGFPWLSIGYSTIHSPLAAYAPIGGVFLNSLLLALCSGALALAFVKRQFLSIIIALLVIVMISGGGLALRQQEWTRPIGDPVSVRMVQGNIAQELKFLPNLLDDSLRTYSALSFSEATEIGIDLQTTDAEKTDTVAGSGLDLVIWPESAIPTFFSDVDEWTAELVERARQQGTTIMSGGFLTNSDYSEYYNSIKVLGGDEDQVYTKRHLVPFGEFIPFRELLSLLSSLIVIPMSDLTAGSGPVKPIQVNGVNYGMSICFEDAFGGEMRALFPDTNVLINVSNDAWFGDSSAPHQHQEIAAMRALEFERPMLRVTNTGVSSLISERGEIVVQGPQFEATAIDVTVIPRTGNTPFVTLGHWPAVGLAFLMMLVNWCALPKGGRAAGVPPRID